MIENRQVTQVKVWKLIMNMMRNQSESGSLVAVSDDKDKLINWYNDQKADEPYSEPGTNPFSGGPTTWHKVFKKGSLLEWFNPVNTDKPDHYNHGFIWEWVDSEFYYSDDVPYLKIV